MTATRSPGLTPCAASQCATCDDASAIWRNVRMSSLSSAPHDTDRNAGRIGGMAIDAFVRKVELFAVAVEQVPQPLRGEMLLRIVIAGRICQLHVRAPAAAQVGAVRVDAAPGGGLSRPWHGSSRIGTGKPAIPGSRVCNTRKGRSRAGGASGLVAGFDDSCWTQSAAVVVLPASAVVTVVASPAPAAAAAFVARPAGFIVAPVAVVLRCDGRANDCRWQGRLRNGRDGRSCGRCCSSCLPSLRCRVI